MAEEIVLVVHCTGATNRKALKKACALSPSVGVHTPELVALNLAYTDMPAQGGGEVGGEGGMKKTTS